MFRYENTQQTVSVDINNLWIRILADIAENVGPGCCQSWFEKASPLRLDEGFLLMRTQQRLVRDRLLTQYNNVLLSTWQKYVPQITSIDIMVDSLNDSEDRISAQVDEKSTYSKENSKETRKSNDINDNCLDPRLTFDNFVVGKPNEFAYNAAVRVSECEKIQFNPLFLYGGVGLGKTHLMHAIAWKISQNDNKRQVMYMSAEKFMYQFIRSIRFHDTMAFKEHFRSVDVLMIDDFQFIGGKETTQEEFFHTFNALVDSNKQIIISADKSPSDLENIGDRLKSRLGWGLVADIHPTTYELRLSILQLKADALNIDIPKDVLDFLATKIVSNVRELEGALNRIMAHASLIGRKITLESTQEILRDLLKSNERYITIEDIQRRTSEFFSIKMANLLSSKRDISVARPRQVAMYLCKVLTTKSLPEIGKKFGGRDHTTVIHAVKKVQELCLSNAEFAHDLETLKMSLC
jgi:chromosomal replication initiator protein